MRIRWAHSPKYSAGIWLFQFSPFYKAFKAVVFSVCIFDIHKHSEAVLERNVFHVGIVKLDPKRICHRSKAHFDSKREIIRWVALSRKAC